MNQNEFVNIIESSCDNYANVFLKLRASFLHFSYEIPLEDIKYGYCPNLAESEVFIYKKKHMMIVRFDDFHYQSIQKISELHQCSMADIIRFAVDSYVKKKGFNRNA